MNPALTQSETNPSFRHFIWLIYTAIFFADLTFIYPLYAIMFSENGVSYNEISILLMVWCLAALLFSLPMGALADKYSRKHLLILGCVFKAMCFVIWIFIPNFWGYLTGFLFWGIDWAISSAALEALIYDRLKEYKKEHLYSKIQGRISSIGIISYIIASGGSFLAFLGYTNILILSIGAVAASLLCFAFLPVGKSYKKVTPVKITKAIKIGIKILKTKPRALKLLVLMTAIVGLGYIDEYFGLIGVEIGMETKDVGILFICAYLSNALGSFNAHWFKDLPPKSLLYGTGVMGALFTAVFLIYNMAAIVLISTAFFVYGILFNLLLTRYQRLVPSASRGMMMSFYSFFEQITTMISYLIMMTGYMLGGYNFGFLILGLLVLFISCIYLLCKIKI